MIPGFGQILTVVCVAYLCHSIWTLSSLFVLPPCREASSCMASHLEKGFSVAFYLYTHTSSKQAHYNKFKMVWSNTSLDARDTIFSNFNISLPASTRRNGSLYLHAYACVLPSQRPKSGGCSHSVEPITAFAVPELTAFNLLGGEDKNGNTDQKGEGNASSDEKKGGGGKTSGGGGKIKSKTTSAEDRTVTHWRPKIVIHIMTDLSPMNANAPIEIFRYVRTLRDGGVLYYQPILVINRMLFKEKDLQPLKKGADEMPLEIEYSPISVGKLRLFTTIEGSLSQMQALGFNKKDTDEVKGIFTDTNLYFLCLTFVVSTFHILFDVLAFKNEISFWRQRRTMVGVSSRAVSWRCVSTVIVFLYLLDQKTSMIILIPSGISSVIEMWKVKKAFKMTIHWEGRIPHFQFGDSSKKEMETEEFDAKAMRYLSYVLYPLCACGAVYSLYYVSHKSWYSWCVQSLVNGVYAFGFLFMLPQLFVNYKLKSVAHLPWKAFMYKAFNTFIDDVFAFIITMPTAHRLACFRDDIIFVIYLYQRWLYPVDNKRVNEFGQSFDDDGLPVETAPVDGSLKKLGKPSVETKKDK